MQLLLAGSTFKHFLLAETSTILGHDCPVIVLHDCLQILCYSDVVTLAWPWKMIIPKVLMR
jgi:hypothetical protein